MVELVFKAELVCAESDRLDDVLVVTAVLPFVTNVVTLMALRVDIPGLFTEVETNTLETDKEILDVTLLGAPVFVLVVRGVLELPLLTLECTADEELNVLFLPLSTVVFVEVVTR